MLLLIIYIILSVLFYFLITSLLKYRIHWGNKNVPHENLLAVLKNSILFLLRRKSLADLIQHSYDKFPDKRYVGFYLFHKPTLLIRDPDLIKKLTVKEFDTFSDHTTFASEDVDPLWAKNLIAVKGPAKWQALRSRFSPAFTSSKMKFIFEVIKDCTKQFTDHFLRQEGTVTVEMVDALSRFTNDVISSAAFGVTCNSLENRDNVFYSMARNLTNFTGIRAFRFVLYTISPTLTKVLKIGMFPKSISSFFHKLIHDTLETREENGIIRNDLLHLLLEAKRDRLKLEDPNCLIDSGFAAVQELQLGTIKKKHKLVLTDEDITAQALVFFLTGFDTVSIFLTFTFYELAVNQDIQQKLRKEIDQTLENCNGQFTYESIMDMKYLDMVVSETLRKWPNAPAVDRVANRSFTIESGFPGEKPVVLEAGVNIWIPIIGLHRDPNYYPNPEKFYPERFNEENKRNIKPFAYLPFGAGPRSCIASRFALVEGKLIITEILSKFEVVPVEKTEIPFTMDKTSFTAKPKNGLWLGLKPR